MVDETAFESLEHLEKLYTSTNSQRESAKESKQHIVKRTRWQLLICMAITSKINESEFLSINTTKEFVMAFLQRESEIIVIALQQYLKGNLLACYDLIYKLCFESECEVLRMVELPSETEFYRLRYSSVSRDFMFNSEMFHIPFEKSHLVSNQRYSISGFPSLYIAQNITLCWREILNPEKKTEPIFACKLTNKVPLRLIDMTYPRKIKSVSDILSIPLTMVTTLLVTHKGHPFMPEYIISQAILQSIVNKNRLNINTENYIDGIVYHSSHYTLDNKLFKSYEESFNIVIPTINETDAQGGLCDILTEIFLVTNGIKTIRQWDSIHPSEIREHLDKQEPQEILTGARSRTTPTMPPLATEYHIPYDWEPFG